MLITPEILLLQIRDTKTIFFLQEYINLNIYKNKKYDFFIE